MPREGWTMNYPIMLVFFALGVTATRCSHTLLYRVTLVAAVTTVIAMAIIEGRS